MSGFYYETLNIVFEAETTRINQNPLEFGHQICKFHYVFLSSDGPFQSILPVNTSLFSKNFSNLMTKQISDVTILFGH